MGVGEGDKFVCEEDGVGVVVDVEVVDGEVVESAEYFVVEYLCGEGVQFCEVVFWVCAVVGLEQFCEKEDSVGACGCEDGGFFGFFVQHLDLLIFEFID